MCDAAWKTLKQAVTISFGSNSESPKPSEDTTIFDLFLSYNAYGKANIEGELIKQSNWDTFYKKIKNKLDYSSVRKFSQKFVLVSN